jgi:hypothetical protein
MKPGRLQRTATHRRPNRRHRWPLEQLERRTLLSSIAGSDIGDVIPLNTPTDVRTGSVAPGSAVFFELNASTDARLVARVQNAGGHTRLLLLDSLGRLLVQSDGQSAANPDELLQQHIPGIDLQLMSWGDGSGVPTSGTDLAIVGTDDNGLLHIRIFNGIGDSTDTFEVSDNSGALHLESIDASGKILSDVLESELTPTQAGAISTLKQQLPGWLPPHLLTNPEKEQVISEVASIIDQTLPTGTVYLEVQSLGAAATFVLSSDLAPASEPSQPIPEVLQSNVFGDFNGDGLPDLGGAGGVQLNLGDGTFGPAIPLPVDGNLVNDRITSGYFDGTGRLDFAVAMGSDQGSMIEALLNNGAGTFQTAPTSLNLDTSFDDLNAIIAGNFEGRGRTDLVVSLDEFATGITSLAVIPGDGHGGFLPPTNYSLGTFSPTTTFGRNLVAADFTGRGLDDIAAAGTDATGRNVIDILINNGHGAFSPTVPIELGDSRAVDLLAGDFNGDGRNELAVVLSDRLNNTSVEVFQIRGNGTFQAQRPVDLGVFDPFSSAVADFNLDHRLDIAVVGIDPSDTGMVDVLLNQGDGSFRAAPPITLGTSNLTGLGAGDFTGDGRPDLVVLSSDESTSTDLATVLPGNGDGSFRTAKVSILKPIIDIPKPINDASFFGGTGVFLEGDFNGDGRPDLAVTEFSSVQVFLGAGNGTFRALPPIEVLGLFTDATAIVAGDFNGDGHLDLAIGGQDTTSTENKLVVLLGHGDGTFGAPIPFNLGGVIPTSAVVGDFTGNGPDDLIIEGTDTSYSTFYELFQGNRNGRFGAPVLINLTGLAPGQSAQLATGDFTGIGHDELAAVGSGFPAIPGNGSTSELGAVILQVNPDGTTTSVASADLGTFALYDIGAGDFGRRGRSSLAVLTQHVLITQQSVLAKAFLEELSFDRDGTPSISTPIDLGTLGPSAFAVADFNGDGVPDLAIGGGDQSGTGNTSILVAEGSSDGTFQLAAPTNLGTLVPFGLVAGDFTGDGRTDLTLTLGSGVGKIDLLRGNGDGTFGSARAVEPVPINNGSVQSAGGPFVAGDFNSDGRLDVAVGGEAPTGQGRVTVLLGNGDGVFAAETPTTLGFRPTALATGDFNGDGLPDLVAAGVDSLGRANIEVLLGAGQGITRSMPPIVLGDFAPDPLTTGMFTPVNVLLGDFTGDGHLDLAVVGTDDSGNVGVELLHGHGDGTFAAPIDVNLGKFLLNDATVGDLTGDGRLDIAVAGFDSRAGGRVEVLPGNGDGTFRSPVVITTGSLIPAALGTGDFNGDGRLDLAVAVEDDATGQGRVLVLLNNGDQTYRELVPIALGEPFPGRLLTGDFNGDGQPDIAVVTDTDLLGGTSSSIVVLAGQGDGTFGSPIVSHLADPQIPTVAGDLIANGRTDLVFNPGGTDIQTAFGLGDGRFLPLGDVVTSVRDNPVVANPGDGTADVFVADQYGNIHWRQGRPDAPGSFQPPITINPGNPSRDFAMVPTTQGFFIASVDLQDNAVSLYVDRDGVFQRTGSLPTGSLPTRIIAGDLNGDGNTDLVVGDVGDGTAIVYLGNGRGGFVEQAVLQLGLGVSDLGLVQLDPHEPVALIVTDQNTGDVRVFPGNGDGSFGSPSVYQAGYGPYALAADGTTDLVSQEMTAGAAAGTFRRDGQTDVAVIDPGSKSLAVLDGLGGGALANPRPFFTTTPAAVVVAGDFNGDGVSDLALLGSDGVSVYLGDGKGGFGAPTTYSVGADPTGLSVADLNGHPDLLIANGYGDVLVLLGDGAGHFATPRNINQQVALAVVDLGTNGQKTFAFAEQGDNRISVQAGGAAQPQTLAGRPQGILDPGAVTLADLNGDGIPDLVVANSGANDVLVYPGLSGGGFGPAQTFPAGTDPVGVTVADLNGDGIPDLVVANEGSNDLSILLGQGRGPAWTLTPSLRLTAGLGPTSTVVRDVSGTGNPDILVSDSQSNDVRLIKGVGGGFFNDTNPTIFSTGIGPTSVLVGNFTGRPGQLDMVTINAGSNTLSQFLDINGGGNVAQTLPSGGSVPIAAVAGDFGGGTTDLLVANNADGHLAFFVGGAGGLNLSRTFEEPGLANPTALAVDSTGSIFGASEGVAAAVVVVLGLGPESPSNVVVLGLGPESPSTVTVGGGSGPGGIGLAAAPAEQQVVLLQPLAQASLALVATLLSVTAEEPAGTGTGSGTTGPAALPNQSQSESAEATPADGGGPQGAASVLETLATNLGQAIAAEVARFVSGLDRALAKVRGQAGGDRLFIDPEGQAGTARPAQPPDEGSARQPPPAGGVAPAVPAKAKAADLGDPGTAPGLTAPAASLPATMEPQRPIAAIPDPIPNSTKRPSPAQAALVIGTFSMGWVTMTRAFADLIPAGPSRTSARSATPAAPRRRQP